MGAIMSESRPPDSDAKAEAEKIRDAIQDAKRDPAEQERILSAAFRLAEKDKPLDEFKRKVLHAFIHLRTDKDEKKKNGLGSPTSLHWVTVYCDEQTIEAVLTRLLEIRNKGEEEHQSYLLDEIIDQADVNGGTLFNWICEKNEKSPTLISKLFELVNPKKLNQGIARPDNLGRTPLYDAAINENSPAFKALITSEIIKPTALNAALLIQTKQGLMTLYHAAVRQNPAEIRALRERIGSAAFNEALSLPQNRVSIQDVQRVAHSKDKVPRLEALIKGADRSTLNTVSFMDESSLLWTAVSAPDSTSFNALLAELKSHPDLLTTVLVKKNSQGETVIDNVAKGQDFAAFQALIRATSPWLVFSNPKIINLIQNNKKMTESEKAQIRDLQSFIQNPQENVINKPKAFINFIQEYSQPTSISANKWIDLIEKSIAKAPTPAVKDTLSTLCAARCLRYYMQQKNEDYLKKFYQYFPFNSHPQDWTAEENVMIADRLLYGTRALIAPSAALALLSDAQIKMRVLLHYYQAAFKGNQGAIEFLNLHTNNEESRKYFIEYDFSKKSAESPADEKIKDGAISGSDEMKKYLEELEKRTDSTDKSYYDTLRQLSNELKAIVDAKTKALSEINPPDKKKELLENKKILLLKQDRKNLAKTIYDGEKNLQQSSSLLGQKREDKIMDDKSTVGQNEKLSLGISYYASRLEEIIKSSLSTASSSRRFFTENSRKRIAGILKKNKLEPKDLLELANNLNSDTVIKEANGRIDNAINALKSVEGKGKGPVGMLLTELQVFLSSALDKIPTYSSRSRQ